MAQLLGASITDRIAVGPHQDRKVFTLQTLPGCEEPFEAWRPHYNAVRPHSSLGQKTPHAFKSTISSTPTASISQV